MLYWEIVAVGCEIRPNVDEIRTFSVLMPVVYILA